jgi:membrane fusion protein (multidrug efflux system)
MRDVSRLARSLGACLVAAALAGCSKQGSAPAAPPPPAVIAMQVIHRDATLTGEFVGQVSAFREVALRPEVTGTVQKILFEPGQRVRDNQLLFVIDPRAYEANLSEAQGAVADAEASLARATQDVARYEPLLPDNAIPRATYDAAIAAKKSAAAALTQRQAAVARARIDIRHTEVRSPVTGQIGLQQVEIGGLAISGQTVLAVVSTLDPVYVNFSIPEADYVRVVRRFGSREAATTQARANAFRLTLPDGSTYEHPGSFDFAARAISATTGTLAVRLKFPNPENLLRPGMNARVRVILEEIPGALLVPQRAVTELLGKQFVTVIGAGNKTEQRLVTLGDRIDELWVVKSGLAPGERIVVEGVQKAPAGTIVAPTMITEAQLGHASAPAVAGSPATPAAGPKAPAPASAAPKSPPQ